MGNASGCTVERNFLGAPSIAVAGSCDNYITAMNEFMSVFGLRFAAPVDCGLGAYLSR